MIKQTVHVTDVYLDTFNHKLKEGIESVQNSGLVVEVLYQVALQKDGRTLYSALLLGRETQTKVDVQ